MLLVVEKQQDATVLQLRAILQGLRGDDFSDTFDSYRHAMLPWLAKASAAEESATKKKVEVFVASEIHFDLAALLAGLPQEYKP